VSYGRQFWISVAVRVRELKIASKTCVRSALRKKGIRKTVR
jgi:hypothetical protein